MNCKYTAEHITNWLKQYAKTSGMKGFVIGVSGGVDSAVTSLLVAKTELPLLCIEMPIHQHETQVKRASDHIDWLVREFSNVSRVETELTDVFDTMIEALPKVENEQDRWMSLANTRARLRMTTLYYFAGLDSQLVVGTGNKIEDFGIGFYTKYGDGGVDISPIADLVKSEVFELGKFLGVSNEILSAPPTDGLWGDDRTDEDQIGASYPELEWAMNYQEEVGVNDSLSEREREVLAIYKRLNQINQHKMKPIPICVIPQEFR